MVWSWCLLKANHETHKFPFNKQDLEIKRGQFVSGIEKAIQEMPITSQNFRTAIKYLKSTGRLTVKSTNKFSIYTIVKWEQYQSNNDKLTGKSTGKLTNHSQATNKPLTTYNNVNNDNKKKPFYKKWNTPLYKDRNDKWWDISKGTGNWREFMGDLKDIEYR